MLIEISKTKAIFLANWFCSAMHQFLPHLAFLLTVASERKCKNGYYAHPLYAEHDNLPSTKMDTRVGIIPTTAQHSSSPKLQGSQVHLPAPRLEAI